MNKKPLQPGFYLFTGLQRFMDLTRIFLTNNSGWLDLFRCLHLLVFVLLVGYIQHIGEIINKMGFYSFFEIIW